MTARQKLVWWAVLAAAVSFAIFDYLRAGSDPGGQPWLRLGVGGTYIGAGLIAWRRAPTRRIAGLMIGTGFAWFVALLSDARTPLLVSLGFSLFALPIGMALHVVLTYPSGRFATRSERLAMRIGYTIVLARAVAGFLFVGRWPDCGGCKGIAPWPHPDAFDLFQMSTALFVPLSAVLMFFVVRRFVNASTVRRRALGELWVAGALFVFIQAAEAAWFALETNPPATLLDGVFVAQMLIPMTLLIGLFRLQLSKAAVGSLALELERTDGSSGLRDALAKALGDPTAEIAYWLPDRGIFVDETGAPVAVSERSGRAVTMIERGGVRLAAVLHDPELGERRELVDAAAAAAGLLLENARLQADLLAQLHEVRASRARIVEATDAERARIERDLHDGAQQRLLSISFALRAAQRQSNGATPALAATLAAAAEEVDLALSELRDFARGIHPAILSEQGLGPALLSLAERAQVPTQVLAEADGRFPSAVETTAYFVAAESLANIAKHARASTASITTHSRKGRLIVEVADDGIGGADARAGSGLKGLEDRVAAVGGHLIVESEPGRGTRVSADIPCE